MFLTKITLKSRLFKGKNTCVLKTGIFTRYHLKENNFDKSLASKN